MNFRMKLKWMYLTVNILWRVYRMQVWCKVTCWWPLNNNSILSLFISDFPTKVLPIVNKRRVSVSRYTWSSEWGMNVLVSSEPDAQPKVFGCIAAVSECVLVKAPAFVGWKYLLRGFIWLISTHIVFGSNEFGFWLFCGFTFSIGNKQRWVFICLVFKLTKIITLEMFQKPKIYIQFYKQNMKILLFNKNSIQGDLSICICLKLFYFKSYRVNFSDLIYLMYHLHTIYIFILSVPFKRNNM